MSTRPFDIFVEKLHSRMLVEASAGTGKTYNIVGLYVRLLIEKNLNVNRILVVTFTRMATRELKERLYSRLKESLKVSTDGEYKGSDPFLKKLSDFCKQHENSSDILRKAIRNFDEAQVLTIHGFCQKVLKEEALASGMPFDFDVVQSDRFLVEAAQDFWRWFVDCHSQSRAGRYYINLVSSYGATPEELVRTLKPLFTKPYARTEPEHTGVEGKEVSRLQSIIDKREEIRTLWRQERDVILEEMFNSDVSGMGKKKVEKWGLQFDTFAEDSNFKEDQPKNLKKFTSSYLNNEENLKKNGEKIPVHPLFDLCDEYASLVEQIPEVKTSFLLYACREIRRLRKQKTREASQLSYEDLLTLLKRALTNPSGGSQLATRLRKKYPVALVDEFQDTDPIQYHIFNRIYEQNDDENTLLMLIGDPKQAIYGFRGADVYAYLRARESVKPEQSFTLTKNYRSSEGLIAGVNALFSSSPDPFIEEKISFSPAQKGELPAEKKLTYTRQTNAPLQIYFRDGISTGSESRRHLFEIAGDQVAELIRDGKKGNARVGENPLQAGDIAILVSRHRDASDLKECLKARGVDSITYSRKKVFESREARRLRRLMGAVLYPSDRRRVQTALVSGFFGVEIEHLYEMQQNDEEWETLNDHLRSLNERWYESGFYPMFRKILFENKALEHFARIQDSERVITNLQQLAEICSYAELDHEFDPSGLYYWFCKQVAEPEENDEQTLRLESDRHLVKISTIHNSKGLEFPIVFLPALWDVTDLKQSHQTIEEYHQTDDHDRAVLNVEQGKSETRRNAEFRSQMEYVAEEVRKAYVALTRAKYECRVFWAATRSSHTSGLGAALIGGEKVKRSIMAKKDLKQSEEISDESYRKQFEVLSKKLPGSLSFHEVSDMDGKAGEKEKPEQIPDSIADRDTLSMATHNLPPHLYSRKQLYSFSSLYQGTSEKEPGPDYDQWLERYIERANERRGHKQEKPTIFTFPRGALAGTLIHKLFEHPDFDFREAEKNEKFIREILQEFGFEEKWVKPLKDMMVNVTLADYNGLKLNEISPDNLLKEMEFHFPTSQPSADDLIRAIRIGNKPAQLPAEYDIQGYMNGFIDLIVRQNGLYYILDYKSNDLGSTLKDYEKDSLDKEMNLVGYDIQYHIYVLALKKYLENREPGFRYENHFGGVYYLFVRGIKAQSDNGIYNHKPDLQTMELLEQLLHRNQEGEDV